MRHALLLVCIIGLAVAGCSSNPPARRGDGCSSCENPGDIGVTPLERRMQRSEPQENQDAAPAAHDGSGRDGDASVTGEGSDKSDSKDDDSAEHAGHK